MLIWQRREARETRRDETKGLQGQGEDRWIQEEVMEYEWRLKGSIVSEAGKMMMMMIMERDKRVDEWMDGSRGEGTREAGK